MGVTNDGKSWRSTISNLPNAGRAFRTRTGAETALIYPSDPDDHRARITVDSTKAPVVLRIFEEFARGGSPLRIAARLNEEGVPAPGAEWDRRRRRTDASWQKTAIREMLDNWWYIGRVIFNRYEWRRVPGTNCRRRIQRPQSEWLIREEPALRFVAEELWSAVRARRDGNRAAAHQIAFERGGELSARAPVGGGSTSSRAS